MRRSNLIALVIVPSAAGLLLGWWMGRGSSVRREPAAIASFESSAPAAATADPESASPRSVEALAPPPAGVEGDRPPSEAAEPPSVDPTESEAALGYPSSVPRIARSFAILRERFDREPEILTALSLTEHGAALLLDRRGEFEPSTSETVTWREGADRRLDIGGRRYWVLASEFPEYLDVLAASSSAAPEPLDADLTLRVRRFCERVESIRVR